MRSVWQDVRYASRVFRAHPAAVAIAVLSLALGVGANSVVFSLVDGMFLRPLPVSDPSSLVRIEWQSVDGRTSAMAWADLQVLRESGGAFADLAAQNRRGGLLGTGGDVELTLVTIVSDNYFPLLGIGPARGRLFRADLDEALEHEPAVAISDGLWRRRFGTDPGLVGRALRLNNRAFTVVGVLPPSFRGLSRGVVTDIWVPVSSWRAMGNAREFEERVVGQFEAIGRLKAGASLGAAQSQLDVFTSRLRREQPEASRGRRLVARTQSEFESAGRGRLLSALLLSITGLLVVIACANVAQLLLALSESRRREMAIRQALGASRGRLVRQLLTESALLAAAGGVVAMLVAACLIPLLPSLLPPGPSFVRYDIRIDLRVVVATVVTCTLTVLFFGLVPAVQGARVDLNSVIKTGGWISRRRFSGRNLLVVVQAMLGVTLLSAAGLLALSFARAQEADPGFDTDRNTLLVLASLSGPADRRTATGDEIAARVAALPGMKRAAYCRRFPMASSGGGATRDVVIPGREAPPGQEVLRIRYNQISPDYLAVTGTRLLSGRAFSRADADGALRVAMVNDTMARQFWPAGRALGSWVRVDNTDVQVVGVVEDAAVNSFHEQPQPFLYFPFAQLPAGEMTFVFEAFGEPAALLPAIRREMRATAPGYVQLTVNTLRQHMKDALYQDWLQAVLSIALAIAGMVLASVGLVGVIIHSVERRTREIGIRAALGARRRDVVAMVLKEGLWLSGLGGVLGIGLSWVAGRAMASLLFGVSAGDPFVIGSSVAAVLAIGLLGSAYPAWKAARVDPAHVLRAE
jgi:putative ABC transport system permease protein